MYYTKSHEWVKEDGEVFQVGITDWAQRELGEIVFIELPKVGAHLKRDDLLCIIETMKAAADIYCPFDGVVESINTALGEYPGWINKSAEEKGWIVKMRGEPKELLSELEYQKLTDVELHL